MWDGAELYAAFASRVSAGCCPQVDEETPQSCDGELAYRAGLGSRGPIIGQTPNPKVVR